MHNLKCCLLFMPRYATNKRGLRRSAVSDTFVYSVKTNKRILIFFTVG